MEDESKSKLRLQKHQQDAYNVIKDKKRGSVVMPTGCGKSFVALQLMEDNKDKRILFMAPTIAIKNQMYNYIAKYIVGEEPSKKRTSRMIAEEYFPNLKIMLYPSLLRVKDEQMEKLNADVIIMDELHRTGADKWGERVNTLLDKNEDAQVLGLTATPDRMDDKNVVDELFEGNIDYELTLVDALRDRIVTPPDYVKCDYALKEHLNGIQKAIDKCDNEQDKKKLKEKFNKMRKIVDQADGIPELFKKNIKKKDGKYIVFCKDKEHMEELMEQAKEWFKDIDSEPEMYSVYSGKGFSEKKNKESIANFEDSKSEHMKLLFTIDMLNEGLHVEDITGVIMARPTESRIIYLQQLGRALSSDTTREKPIIFDLVNNYIKNNLDKEINKGGPGEPGGGSSGPGGTTGIDDDLDTFRIQGETKDFLDLLEEINGILSVQKSVDEKLEMLEQLSSAGVDVSLLQYNDTIETLVQKSGIDKKEIEKLEIDLNYKIGLSIHSVKMSYKGKGEGKKPTEEQIERFKKLGIDLDERKGGMDTEEKLEMLEKLSSIGVDVSLLKFQDTIETLVKKSGIDKKEIEKLRIDLNYKIGPNINSLKLAYKGTLKGIKPTEEQIERFKKLGIDLDERKAGIDTEEKLEMLEKLSSIGVDVSLFSAKDTIEVLAQKSGIDKKEIEKLGIDLNYKIGTCINTIKSKYKGTMKGKKPTEEQIERLKKIGIDLDENKVGIGTEGKLEMLEKLSSIGVDVSLLKFNDTIETLMKKNGIDKKEIEKLGIDLNYNIGLGIRNIKAAYKGKDEEKKPTEEQIERLKKIGINLDERKGGIEVKLEMLEQLSLVGIDVSLLKIKDTIETLAQKNGIDKKEIEKLGIDLNYKIGEGINNVKRAYKGTGTGIKPTEEQIERFKELGIEFKEKENDEIEQNNIENKEQNQQTIQPIEKEEQQEELFSEQQIGKNTVNVSVTKKQEANIKVTNDIQQAKENNKKVRKKRKKSSTERAN